MIFTTKYSTKESDKNKENYYLNRGFIDLIYRGFGTTTRELDYTVNYVSQYTNSSEEEYPYMYYISYLRAAMYYTKAEFQEKYPPELYPLINEKYEMVVQHMKEEGIDLEQIANGPKE